MKRSKLKSIFYFLFWGAFLIKSKYIEFVTFLNLSNKTGENFLQTKLPPSFLPKILFFKLLTIGPFFLLFTSGTFQSFLVTSKNKTE